MYELFNWLWKRYDEEVHVMCCHEPILCEHVVNIKECESREMCLQVKSV